MRVHFKPLKHGEEVEMAQRDVILDALTTGYKPNHTSGTLNCSVMKPTILAHPVFSVECTDLKVTIRLHKFADEGVGLPGCLTLDYSSLIKPSNSLITSLL